MKFDLSLVIALIILVIAININNTRPPSGRFSGEA